MVLLLLGLDLVPVGKAVQPLGAVEVGHIQVQVGGVQLLIDLFVQQFGNLFIHDENTPYVLLSGLRPKAPIPKVYHVFFGCQPVFTDRASASAARAAMSVIAPADALRTCLS